MTNWALLPRVSHKVAKSQPGLQSYQGSFGGESTSKPTKVVVDSIEFLLGIGLRVSVPLHRYL